MRGWMHVPFAGYKLQFELNAKHRNINNTVAASHPHTFTITLYLKKSGKEFVRYEEIEKNVSLWLQQYQGKDLNSTDLFQNSDATLESIGETFYQVLKGIVEPKGYELVRLDINENPVRTYSVSEKPLDNSVNELSAPIEFPQEQSAFGADMPERNQMEQIRIRPKDGQNADLPKPIPVPVNKPVLDSRKRQPSKPKIWKVFAAVLFLLLCSAATVYLIKINGLYPSGYDVMYHLYRSSSLSQSISNGDWYPLYDRYLYNGVQTLRYWPPLPVYVMSLFQLLTGSMLNSYLLYTGFIFFLGGCGWLLFGWEYNRITFSALAGALWFFAPDNMMVFFGSGNLPRAMVAALLPYFLFFVWKFVEGRKWRSMIPVMLITPVMFLSHSGETGIVLLCLLLFLLIFLLIHAMINRRIKEHLLLMLGILLSVLVIGIWMYPSVHGGLVSMSGNDTQNLKSSFANGWTSLNPLARLSDKDSTYFGLSFFLLSVFGLFLGNKKTFPGFLTGIMIYFGTTLSLYPFISKLPMANLLWMTRFITVALALIFLSFLLWKQLKTAVVVVFCLLIALDSLPSIQYINTQPENRISNVSSAQMQHAQEISLTDAKVMTVQRMALLDQSSYGSFAPWYLAGVKPETMCTYGAAWSSAQTASNIVQLNTAFSFGYYDYLFDRCLELGNDTVQLRISLLQHGAQDISKAEKASNRLGYQLVKQTSSNLLFHKSVSGTFGTKTIYKGIAIGSSARDIALLYPVYKETTDGNLNHYSYDQLKQYSNLYLSGFTYDDRDAAEQMLKKLASGGTKIYIDMNRVPTDPSTKRQRFFEVEAQNISFEDRFPDLQYKGTDYQVTPFPKDFSKWTTVYLTGLKNMDGYSMVNDKQIAFAGTGTNPNIYFLGFNLLYYEQTSSSSQAVQLLNQIFQMKDGELPERRIVPVTVSYSPRMITVQTNEDHVNTSLAWHDIFQSNRSLHNDNNLLAVDRGTTTIQLTYPYFGVGLGISIAGIVLSVLYFFLLSFLYRNVKNQNVCKEVQTFSAQQNQSFAAKHYAPKTQKQSNHTGGKHYAK